MKTSNILNRFDLFPDAEVVEDSDGDEIRRHTAKLDSEYGQKYGAHPLSSVVKGPAANLILASMGYFSYFKRNEDDSAWMVQFKGSRSEAEKLAKLLRRSVKSKKIWEYRSPLFVVYSDNGKGGIIRNEPPAPEVKKEGIPEKRNKLENRITDFFPQAKVKFEGNASRGYRVHVVPPRKANIKPFYISFMTFEDGMEKFEDLMNKHGIRTASKGEKMSTKLKNQLIKLGSTNPELRPHLRPVLDTLTGNSRFARVKNANGPHPIDPRKAMVYFEVGMEDYNIEEDAEDPRSYGHEIAKKIMADSYEAVKMESAFVKELSRMLGVSRILDEGHDAQGMLLCKFGVDTYQDIVKLQKALNRHHTGGDDRIEGNTPYFYAEGFTLFPEGVNGPTYGPSYGGRNKGDLDDWLQDHKPKR